MGMRTSSPANWLLAGLDGTLPSPSSRCQGNSMFDRGVGCHRPSENRESVRIVRDRIKATTNYGNFFGGPSRPPIQIITES